ncbi:MAG: hypothetical protein ACI9FR_000734 [Cryomorphaceae bacterium]|jgi:hypothetical protein
MIRLFIIAVGVFLIWVLFVSGFSRQRKVVIAALAVALSIAAVWFESSLGSPNKNVLTASEVVDCGSTAVHSYRSNFDVTICFNNNSAMGDVKRINFEVLALQCDSAGACTELQRVGRELSIELPANESITLQQSLSFPRVQPVSGAFTWQVQVNSLKAVKTGR